MSEVRCWLEALGLDVYAAEFEANAIELDQLATLTDLELKELGVAALGHRKRIRDAAQSTAADPATSIPGNPQPTSSPVEEVERRQLTVLFCDLVGSVALAESMDVEDYRDLLSNFRTTAVESVEDNGGFVARHQGDGLLAYFGYPRAREDDAERAARAGLQMLSRIRDMVPLDGHELKMRVGVATGQAVVGDRLDTGGAHELGALGRTPNLAARLQGEASANSILISSATAELIAGRFELEALEPLYLKGIEGPVQAFRVSREIRNVTRFGVRTAAHLSEFVGREEELAVLQRRWQQAAAGRGQIVVLIGEPGIGKSRLSGQFRETLGAQVHRTIALQCSPDLVDSPLHPVVSYINTQLNVAATTDVGPAEALSSWVREDVDDDPASLELLADLLSVPLQPKSESLHFVDAEQRRVRTLETVVRHLDTVASGAPAVLLIEDIHWADPTTRELLARLAERTETLRALVIVTSRPGFELAWTDYPHVWVMHLSRLADDESALLAKSAALSPAQLPVELVRDIVSRSSGNPLFIEEIVRSVIQHQATAASDTSVPVTLQDSLMGRLDALTQGKPVAQTASAIGREFDYRLLCEVWDGEVDVVDAGLAELVKDGIVFVRGEGERRSFQFKHALVQDTAYATLLRERRQALHHRIAMTLEHQRPESAVTRPELLARHFSAADDQAKAIELWDSASSRAVDRASHQEAIEHCQQALTALSKIGKESGVDQRNVDFLFRIANSQRMVDQIEEALATLDRAEAILVTMHGETKRQARLHYMRGNLNFTRGRTDECEREHGRALELARQIGDQELALGALSGLGDAAYAKGRMITAERLFDDMLSVCDKYDLNHARAANLSMRADARTYSGQPSMAIQDAEEGCELARANNDIRALVLNCASAALAYYESGDFAKTIERAREGAEMARTLGSANLESFMEGFHARGLVATGAVSAARAIAKHAIKQATRGNPGFAGSMAYSAAALAEPSNPDCALLLGKGEAILEGDCVSHNVFWFLVDAIEVSLRLEDWSRAERYSEMLEDFIANEPLQWAKLHVSLGKAAARIGAGDRSNTVKQQLEEIMQTAGAIGFGRISQASEAALVRSSEL